MRIQIVCSGCCPFMVHYLGAWAMIHDPYHRSEHHYHNWNMWWGAAWKGDLEIVTE